MPNVESCTMLVCGYWPVERLLFWPQGWRGNALSVWQAGAFAFNGSRAHVHLTLWCRAFTLSSWLSLLEHFLKSLPSAELLCSSFHSTYSSPPFMPVDLGSLVIYSCHSRESATLVMPLPHFSNSVCAQTDLFPDSPLFLPSCSFPLPKFFLFSAFSEIKQSLLSQDILFLMTVQSSRLYKVCKTVKQRRTVNSL